METHGGECRIAGCGEQLLRLVERGAKAAQDGRNDQERRVETASVISVWRANLIAPPAANRLLLRLPPAVAVGEASWRLIGGSANRPTTGRAARAKSSYRIRMASRCVPALKTIDGSS
jgi:hypothetical protein